ncbi:MAG: apolipoprotein N-acyltransferase, partial [Kiloniellales bacterium]
MPANNAGTSAEAPGRIVALAGRLSALRGWRGAVAAAGLGALSAGALPPIHLLPLLWLAFPGLLWLLDGARRRRDAFVLGWAFGAGHFAAGLYWIGHAFLVDAERFGAVMPFAGAGLAAGLALFPAAALVLVWSCGGRGLARVFALAGAWVFAEWLRSWVLTGFPWNLIGTVWAFADAPIQLAAATGVWGLSLVTIVAAAAPACLGAAATPACLGAAAAPASLGAAAPGRGPARLLPWVLGLGLPALLWAGGELRLAFAPAPGEAVVEDTVLRIVQPSIDQRLKWQSDKRAGHVAGQMAMSEPGGAGETGGGAVTHIIWAETAVPFLLGEDPGLRRALSKVVPPGGVLLTGAPRRGQSDGVQRVWNTLFALDEDGEVVAAYDKHHLVPFGEYTPLKALFGFAKLTVGASDFSAGEGLRTLSLPGLPPVSPLICYEVIFPGLVVAPGQRPGWILNVTNDAWFGVSSGPYQHFASARLRAVEEGLPLVRAANSGISAVIDAYGRVIARLGLGRVGIIDAPLPRPTQEKTPFGQLGNWT